MELQRFTTLLNAYGANPAHWPADERHAAESLVANSAEAQSLLARHRTLDTALNRYTVTPDTARLRAGILATVQTTRSNAASPGLLDRIIAWLVPEPGNLASLWRPALVATLPLILGMVLGSQVSFTSTDTTQNWDEELSLVALADTDSESLP